MLSIIIDHVFFSIDHQSTSNDRLKPVITTGLVNMHIDRSIANLAKMPVKKLHCTAQIQLLKRWMACSNIMEIARNILLCVKLVGFLKTVHS